VLLKLTRSSGILLHPTSFPSKYGVGELGEEAYAFIDFLVNSGQKLWQILPLNPPGFGDSPYQAYSAFASNPLLISIDGLIAEGLLIEEDLYPRPDFPDEGVDYPRVSEYKYNLYKIAYSRFKVKPRTDNYKEYIQRNFYWLHDYSFFMALREYFKQQSWNKWEKNIMNREKEALGHYENLLAEKIEYQYFLQYIVNSQWAEIKNYARKKEITIIGDIPIFVSYDSADTWVNPHLFELDEEGFIKNKAGVPPDYFSETGQLWGNPHYCWQKMAEDDYFWWRQRIKTMLEMVDVVRLDHFRGFEAYWEIPGDEETAVKGRWVKGPGKKLFSVLKENLDELPLIAEDLGYITPEVKDLKDAFNFPGMKVLQFISEETIPQNPDEENTIYYTGTHDNDTLLGWYKKVVLSGLRRSEEDIKNDKICWEFIKLLLKSNCNWTIFPLQDILCLDSDARMNVPGTVGGKNWQWRYKEGALTQVLEERLLKATQEYER
jgi:4-alpha-glucanotransferase